VVFAVRSLEGLEPLLAAEVLALWDSPAADLNATRRVLDPA
jgi:3-oxoacyl-[acyl-carrier protein] reductase